MALPLGEAQGKHDFSAAWYEADYLVVAVAIVPAPACEQAGQVRSAGNLSQGLVL